MCSKIDRYGVRWNEGLKQELTRNKMNTHIPCKLSQSSLSGQLIASSVISLRPQNSGPASTALATPQFKLSRPACSGVLVPGTLRITVIDHYSMVQCRCVSAKVSAKRRKVREIAKNFQHTVLCNLTFCAAPLITSAGMQHGILMLSLFKLNPIAAQAAQSLVSSWAAAGVLLWSSNLRQSRRLRA